MTNTRVEFRFYENTQQQTFYTNLFSLALLSVQCTEHVQ